MKNKINMRNRGKIAKSTILIVSLLLMVYGLWNRIVISRSQNQKQDKGKTFGDSKNIDKKQVNSNSHLFISCGGFLE